MLTYTYTRDYNFCDAFDFALVSRYVTADTDDAHVPRVFGTGTFIHNEASAPRGSHAVNELSPRRSARCKSDKPSFVRCKYNHDICCAHRKQLLREIRKKSQINSAITVL